METLPTNQLTILFADIANSTRLYESFGDFKARELVAGCLSRLKTLAADHGGVVVKTIGDEVMCTFPSPNLAAEAAMQMQEATALNPKMVRANIHLRIGFHHGEVIHEPADVFGDAVNVAARMVSLSKSDQIITNKETLGIMKPHLTCRARIVDRTRVRGKDDVMEIHELIWGMPEQMTMACSVTEEMIAALTEADAFLQVHFLQQRLLVNRDNPILTVGRGAANHLTVSSRLVSRVHARIELQRSRFMLIDQSTNGTYFSPRGGRTIFLRRDAVRLEGEGMIGLGQQAGEDEAVTLRYQILSDH
jgi:class 3 adenylate cyclase